MLRIIIEICIGVGLVVSLVSYHGWALTRARERPDRLLFGELSVAQLLRGAWTVVGEGLAWALFIIATPFMFFGDYLAWHRRRGDRRPVLLVHGYLHNRSAWLFHGPRLRMRGWTQVYSINLRPVGAPLDDFAQQVAHAVDSILAESGADRVDIVAHSMGGVVSRAYVQKFRGHEHVAHLVTLGSPHRGTDSAPFALTPNALAMAAGAEYLAELDADPEGLRGVATTAVYSEHDNIVYPAAHAALDAPAEVIRFEGLGHASLLLSPRVGDEIVRALEREPEPAAAEPAAEAAES